MATVKDTSGAAALADSAAQDPKVRELDAATTAILADAERFVITTASQYDASGEVLKSIKGRQRELEELRRSMTRPIDDARSRIMALFKPAGDRLLKAETVLKGAMVRFRNDQERKRREAEAAARAEADREAAALRRRADTAERRGNEDKAEELRDRADSVPVPIVTVQQPEVLGVSIRTTWTAEITDLLALVKACADGSQPLTQLLPNMPVLRAQAKALKGELRIPGVRAVAEEGIAARAER